MCADYIYIKRVKQLDMKQRIRILDLELNSKMTYEIFQKSDAYNNQDVNRFFWIQGSHTIEGLEGSYRVGLYFKDQIINTIEIYSMDFEEETAIRKNVLQKIKEIYSLGEKYIIYSFDKRDNYGSVIILF